MKYPVAFYDSLTTAGTSDMQFVRIYKNELKRYSPWRVEYRRNGKIYAAGFSSEIKAKAWAATLV